jgi:ABC-type phosphate transport system substrate-binding protein
MMKNYKNFILLFVMALMASFAQADIVVIVSAKTPVSSLNKEQASDIFLGKVSTFPDGSLAVTIEQPDGSATHDEFHSKVTGKNSAQLKSHWSRVVFTGKGSQPKEVPSSADVKKLVAANPNMIGYVEKSLVDSSVKVVYAP